MRPSDTARRLRWLPLAALLALALPAQAATITVDSGTDDGAGCTLREAVEAANTDTAVGGCAAGDDASDTIAFSVALVTLTAGQIEITEAVEIDGGGTAEVVGAFDERVFLVSGTEIVTFRDLVIRGGGHTGGAADGAAINISSSGVVVVTGTSIVDHSAPTNGGGIYVSATGTLTVTGDSEFTGNTARGTAATEGGGAIYTAGGQVTVFSSTFTDNRALGDSGSGGAISNPFGANLTVTTSTFTQNRARRAGGAIETVGGTTAITGATFDNNIAGPNPGNGGAVHGAGGVALTITDGIAQNNLATSEGGAFWIGGGGTLTVDGTNVRSNVAQGGSSDQGGGGVYNDGATLTVTNAAQFVGNVANGASGSGGAVFANRGSTTITSAAFTRNRATRAGGAIEALGDPIGVPSLVPAIVNVTGSSFDRNRTGGAPGNGGAIHTSPGEVGLTVTGGTFTGNVAEGDGGAIWIGEGTLATVNGASLTGNRTAGSGGAVYNIAGSITLIDATLDGNRARLNGGGLATVGGLIMVPSLNDLRDGGWARSGLAADGVMMGSTTLLGTSVTNNFADQGGGLTADFTDLTVGPGSVVAGNEARTLAGGVASQGGLLTITGASVTDNTSNDVGGVLSVFGGLAVQQSDVSRNTSALLAGGIGVAQTEMLIDQSLISANSAGRDGGGIAAFETIGTVQNATLYGNSARFGGGLYSEGSDLAFSSATVAQNGARNSGGGLANQDPNNGGDRFVTLENTIVADNFLFAVTASLVAPQPNLAGRYGSGGYNVIGTTPPPATFAPLATDQVGTDPMLGPLADNGGPTLTAALMAGSPAIDTGMTDLAVDQRGVARTEPDDVGAVEFGDAAPPVDPAMALVLTGIFDGDRTGGQPKGVEIYVAQDVADLSLYAIGSANNGGGTDGPEFYLTGSATAGEYLYLVDNDAEFFAFFGFGPDFVGGAAAVNGDDAVELFYDDDGQAGGNAAVVVDTYGVPTVNGDGETWDYTDGWGYRKDGTGPDGTTFVQANWTSEFEALVDAQTNAEATTPFPIGTYSPTLPPPVAGTRAGLEAQPLEGPVALSVAPNPFSGRAQATFAVREAQRLDVRVVDVTGREVARLFDGFVEAEAPVTVALDAGTLASGVYVVVVRGETVRTTQTVTVAR